MLDRATAPDATNRICRSAPNSRHARRRPGPSACLRAGTGRSGCARLAIGEIQPGAAAFDEHRAIRSWRAPPRRSASCRPRYIDAVGVSVFPIRYAAINHANPQASNAGQCTTDHRYGKRPNAGLRSCGGAVGAEKLARRQFSAESHAARFRRNPRHARADQKILRATRSPSSCMIDRSDQRMARSIACTSSRRACDRDDRYATILFHSSRSHRRTIL